MRERIIGGYPYYDMGSSRRLRGVEIEKTNPGTFVFLGDRVFKLKDGHLCIPDPIDVHKARILFEATKKSF